MKIITVEDCKKIEELLKKYNLNNVEWKIEYVSFSENLNESTDDGELEISMKTKHLNLPLKAYIASLDEKVLISEIKDFKRRIDAVERKYKEEERWERKGEENESKTD